MSEQVRHSQRTDPPFAQVLVAIVPRSESRRGVVEVDHPQPIEPEQAVEFGQHAVDHGRVGNVVAGAPQVSCVQAEADAPVKAVRGGQLEHRSQLLDVDADAVAAAG